MIDNNMKANIAQQMNVKNFLYEKIASKIMLSYLSKKKEKNSVINDYNNSADYLSKTQNLFNKIYLKKENNEYNSNSNQNEKPENNDKIIYYNYMDNNNNRDNNYNIKISNSSKKFFTKKQLIEKILLSNKKNINNINSSKVNKIIEKDLKFNKVKLFLNDYSSNENENLNKINFLKIKNDLSGNITNRGIKEKLDLIKMNKTALFKKIKFASLRNFCKNVKLNNKKIDLNLGEKKKENNYSKNYNITNETNKNNCDEIKINSIKEKVRNHFIGRFNNIKEYFENWDIRNNGKINVNDIYNYLNKKIKFKISKNNTRKLLYSFNNKNYLDLENFRILFFEESPNEKLSIPKNQFIEYNEYFLQKISERYLLNKSDNNQNESFYEKFKYNEIILFLLKKKNKILSEIKPDKVELSFIEFYSILKKFFNEKRFNYDKELKKLFNDFKDNNSNLINIYYFFEKILEKNEFNRRNKSLINIKKNISSEFRPFYLKNKNPYIILNSRNSNSLNNKNIVSTKTNFHLNSNKIIVENKKNNFNNINDYEKDKNQKNNKILKSNLVIKNNANNLSKEEIIKENNENSKLMEYRLSNIQNKKYLRDKNKNSDIINFL